MSVLVSLDYQLSTLSPTGVGISQTNRSRFAPGAGTGGKRETVSLTGSAYTALSPPSGAKLLVILMGAAVSLTLKGATGDATGIAIAPASNPTGADCLLTLGGGTVGILNGIASTQVVECLWF